AAPRRVALPETDDPRVLAAAGALAASGLARPLLIGRRPVAGLPAELARRLPEAAWRDPAAEGPRAEAAQWLLRRRRDRGLTPGQAHVLAGSPLYHAAVLVARGEADALVAGAATPTAEVLRAALWAIGTAAGRRTVFGAFVMLPAAPDGAPLVFADCAVVPQPDEAQLVEIGGGAGETFRSLTGREPAVAYLSFSTRGSAPHPAAGPPARAAARLAAAHPGWRVAGELQADAALVPEVGRAKGIDWGPGAGADVLVFPDLGSGNIGYKLVERLGGWRAIGPLLLGLRRPACDLSRGCSALDVVDAAAALSLLGGEG
ncbi:MAG: phosphate acyltransferase, partial [Candidatus Krumholzibacteriia bacterium]